MRVIQVQNQKQKQKPRKFRLPWKSLAILIVVLVAIAAMLPRVQNIDNGTSGSRASGFNKQQYSTNDPSSVWAIVNKGRALPSDYIPPDLVAPNVALRLPASDPEMHVRLIAIPSLQQMFKDAGDSNLQLMLSSGYRSYALQSTVYNSNVNFQGQQVADSSSAKPGHSEHQTGLAVDIEPTSRECEVEICFGDTPEGVWLKENAHKYGFIIRYEKGKEKLTGYEFEPWHLRFVGPDLASQLYSADKTMEQFFGLPAVQEYQPAPFRLQAGT